MQCWELSEASKVRRFFFGHANTLVLLLRKTLGRQVRLKGSSKWKSLVMPNHKGCVPYCAKLGLCQVFHYSMLITIVVMNFFLSFLTLLGTETLVLKKLVCYKLFLFPDSSNMPCGLRADYLYLYNCLI